MEAFSLEELARTSDEAAVRRRFDGRNLLWFWLLLAFFLFVALMEFIGSTQERAGTPRQVWVSFANLLFLLLMGLLVLDTRRLGRPAKQGAFYGLTRLARNHVTGFVLFFVTAQYLFLFAFPEGNEAWVAWSISFPLLMLGFRLPVPETLLMHGFFIATAVLRGLLADFSWKERLGNGIGMAVTNLIAVSIVLFFSRRWRREIVSDFTERRSQAREQIRMRDELRYARELQLSMIPERAPAVAWLDLAGVSLPATEVGGDYYDYFAVGDRVALVSGDVAGHGMAAGLVLASLRSGFTLLRESLTDPAAVLQRLHDLVAETSRRRMLATVAVLLLDPETRTATLASAAHPPIIRRRASDGTAAPIELFAPPLGVHLPVVIPQLRFPYAPGDVFVLHTDGVYESRNAEGEVYGLERLTQIVHDHDGTSAEALRDAIVQDVEAFRGEVEQADDVTLVVAIVR
ncbi:MAG TPA: PP2C family protein-serine/threonine phosphatase [Thermoanaerobaculia bacterium]